MKKVLVTGGGMENLNDKETNSALLYLVDLETDEKLQLIKYKGVEGINHNIAFTCGTVKEDMLFLTTRTEIFIYKLPEMNLINYKTHRLFNDNHHINIFDDKLYIVSTGIDSVVEFDYKSLEFIRYIPLSDRDIVKEYPEDFDFRKVDTKPHRVHPNYIFKWNGEIFVSRFYQADIINLKKNLNIKVSTPPQYIHDGFVFNSAVFFTTVDGTVRFLKKGSEAADLFVDLNMVENSKYPLGWCRGVCMGDDFFCVGFTRFRYTKWNENLKCFKEIVYNEDGSKIKYTRIAVYSYTFEKIKEITFEHGELASIFSILPLSEKL